MKSIDADVIVVGAGLAGLACARHLQHAGHQVSVLEASDGVGGRVRSDTIDGFTIDRGFQVLQTAYPEAQAMFDYAKLNLCEFDSSASIYLANRFVKLDDPLRHPDRLLQSLRAPIGSLSDKIRLLALRRTLQRGPASDRLRDSETTTISWLQAQGFSVEIIERFFLPLLSGILLDPDLTTTSRMSSYVLRMLFDGPAAVPAAGMGALAGLLAEGLGDDAVECSVAIDQVTATQVTLADASTRQAKAVVIATDAVTAARLLGDRIDVSPSRAVRGIWYAADHAPTAEKAILLDGAHSGPATNVAVLTNVAPSYSTNGKALIVAALLGDARGEIDAVNACTTQMHRWFGMQVNGWEVVSVNTIHHAQPSQPVGWLEPAERPVALGDGAFVCGDHRDQSSIQGALASGRRCAKAVDIALSSSLA